MLSKKAKYAIKALLALADGARDEPMRIADLAREEQIPPKFLELILLGLKNHGILQSRKGKGGGYLLARDPAEIYLGQIVRMFDGPLAPVPCASQTAYVPCADCRNEAVCGVHLAMKEVRDATARVLDGTSLACSPARWSRPRGRPHSPWPESRLVWRNDAAGVAVRLTDVGLHRLIPALPTSSTAHSNPYINILLTPDRSVPDGTSPWHSVCLFTRSTR